MTYPVVEIFESIQGEGSWMGRPVTFIRLGGCNLSCPWCDTDFTKFTRMDVPEIVAACGYRDVVITGGEPTIHNLRDLLIGLKTFVVTPNGVRMRQIAIETNGTHSLAGYRKFLDWVVCSPKPQSKWDMVEGVYPDEIKYVVDKDWTPDKIPASILQEYHGRIWLQPEASEMELRWKEALKYCLENDAFRVGCQLHKFMNVR